MSETALDAIPTKATLDQMRFTDAAGTSTSLRVPPADLDLIRGPVLRMRVFQDRQGVTHVEYDVAAKQAPAAPAPVPNDPLAAYFLGNIVVKRAGTSDITFSPPQDPDDNVPLDLTKGVTVHTFLTPGSRPIGPLFNIMVEQSA